MAWALQSGTVLIFLLMNAGAGDDKHWRCFPDFPAPSSVSHWPGTPLPRAEAYISTVR